MNSPRRRTGGRGGRHVPLVHGPLRDDEWRRIVAHLAQLARADASGGGEWCGAPQLWRFMPRRRPDSVRQALDAAAADGRLEASTDETGRRVYRLSEWSRQTMTPAPGSMPERGGQP